MTEEEFIQEEQEFLDRIQDSVLYRKTKELSDQISSDPELVALSQKRDDLYERASYCQGEERKHLLEEYHEADTALMTNPIVMEYLENYRKLRKVLGHISTLFTKELTEQ